MSEVHNRFGLFLEDVKNKTLTWGREPSQFQCLDLVVVRLGHTVILLQTVRLFAKLKQIKTHMF